MTDIGVDFGVQLDLHAGKINHRLDELEALLRRPPAQPVITRNVKNGAYPSSGVLVMTLGTPKQGTVWYPRTWTCGGLDPSVSAAGIADLYVSSLGASEVGTVAGVGLGDWVDELQTLPNIDTFGMGELQVRPGEHLTVIVRSGTAAQQYVSTVWFAVIQEGPDRQGWAL